MKKLFRKSTSTLCCKCKAVPAMYRIYFVELVQNISHIMISCSRCRPRVEKRMEQYRSLAEHKGVAVSDGIIIEPLGIIQLDSTFNHKLGDNHRGV